MVTSLWAWWRLKSLASQFFAQPFVQAQIKENIKALCHRLSWGESSCDRWIPLTKGQWHGKCFYFIMFSCLLCIWGESVYKSNNSANEDTTDVKLMMTHVESNGRLLSLYVWKPSVYKSGGSLPANPLYGPNFHVFMEVYYAWRSTTMLIFLWGEHRSWPCI